MESLALSEVERVDDISYRDVVTAETGEQRPEGLWRVWRLAKRSSYAIKMPLS